VQDICVAATHTSVIAPIPLSDIAHVTSNKPQDIRRDAPRTFNAALAPRPDGGIIAGAEMLSRK
jgi:hypothetical protein